MIPKIWLQYLSESRDERIKGHLVRKLRHLRHLGSTRVQIGSRSLVNFSSNDYLGLAGDLRVAEAAAAAAGRFGWGAGASRLVTGSSVMHQKLEQEVAKLRGTESALLFGSGYQANLGVITALVGQSDVVLSDEMNHASIVAGCKLSGAHVRVFKHRDYDDLDRQMGSGGRGRKLVVTDSMFSIEGDVADLPRIIKICERQGGLLLVDDAHANGALGKKGKGVPEMQNVLPHMSIVVGTFSKALGSYGGFVACSNEIREHLVNESRPFIYTTALPVAVAAANLEALRIIQKEGEGLRNKLQGNVRILRNRMQNQGIELTGAHHIIGVRVENADQASFLADEIEAQGMLAYAMRWPTVPKGRDMLRISISAAHTEEEIGRLAQALRSSLEHMGGKRTTSVSRRENKRPSARTLDVAGDGDLDESAFAEEESVLEPTGAHDAPHAERIEVADAPTLDRQSSGRLPVVDSPETSGFEVLLDEELAYEAPENVRVTLLDEAAGAVLERDETDSGGDDLTGRRPAVRVPEPVPQANIDPAEDGWPEDNADAATVTNAETGELAAKGDPLIAELANSNKETRRARTRRTSKRTNKSKNRHA